jgi:PPOX class probable F420-dependent enzyme
MGGDTVQPAGSQRRSDVRVHAHLPVELSARVVSLSLFREEGHESAVLSCETDTLSGGGFSIRHTAEIPVGVTFDVNLHLPDQPLPLTAKAKVVRCNALVDEGPEPHFDVGLVFVRISEANRSRIVSHVFRLQRTAQAERTHNEPAEATMTQLIPEQFMDLFQQPAFANLATLMSDGSPQVTPVWCDFDGRHVVINTAKGRVKDRNMRRSPQVALSIMDPKNPYRYIEIRGRVAEISETGADEHIDKMAKKYLNLEKYPYRTPDEVRVIYRIAPERVSTMG